MNFINGNYTLGSVRDVKELWDCAKYFTVLQVKVWFADKTSSVGSSLLETF